MSVGTALPQVCRSDEEILTCVTRAENVRTKAFLVQESLPFLIADYPSLLWSFCVARRNGSGVNLGRRSSLNDYHKFSCPGNYVVGG